MGILSLVGAHLLAAALGLYSSAPRVTLMESATGSFHPGQLEIAVRVSDGPTGSGVRRVEYQLDSTKGAWTTLTQRSGTPLYTGLHDASALPGGRHTLYLRAVDFTGNQRTLSTAVTVTPAEAPAPQAEPTRETLDVSYRLPQDSAWHDGTPRG